MRGRTRRNSFRAAHSARAASIAARWNLAPEAGTTVSPASRAVLVPRAFPVRLTARVHDCGWK
jgi:hypothetical protein